MSATPRSVGSDSFMNALLVSVSHVYNIC